MVIVMRARTVHMQRAATLKAERVKPCSRHIRDLVALVRSERVLKPFVPKLPYAVLSGDKVVIITGLALATTFIAAQAIDRGGALAIASAVRNNERVSTFTDWLKTSC